MNTRELLRRKLLEEIYNDLSEEDKRTFVQLTMQDKGCRDIMQTLANIEHKADENHHSFVGDFTANVAGNAVWDSILWLGTKLFRKL